MEPSKNDILVGIVQVTLGLLLIFLSLPWIIKLSAQYIIWVFRK